MRLFCFYVASLCLPLPLLAVVDGIVSTDSGTPIEHARVEVTDSSAVAFSDMDGRFRFDEVEPPLLLLITHPRFVAQALSLEPGDPLPVEVVLEAKQEVYEEIAVSANRGEENFSPITVASSVVETQDAATPPATLTEMISTVPTVSENGQGGLLQTYSIRGMSRQRVMTLVSGMRIMAERRAGVSASFLDPVLMSSVDVVRGPSSTYYGSGAIGGVVQLFPRAFDSWAAEAGYTSQGNEAFGTVGWGGKGWSAALAHRTASDSETPDGETLNSAFTQTSGTLQKEWGSGRFRYELLGIGSLASDIGKASTDFPERTTVYPEERHLLLRFAMRAESGWGLEAWAHPNDLVTEVLEESTSFSEVDNQAFDLGLNWQHQMALKGGKSMRFGIDWVGRRNVNARESTLDLVDDELTTQNTLEDGEEDEVGAYGALEWNWGRATLVAGGRLTYQRQSNAGDANTDDSAASGFAGLVVPLGAGFELVGNVGSGLRFPTLSERYFSGVTGRGEVVGNPNLDPERSVNLETGLRWYGTKLFVSGYVFRNDIDDYIERLEVEPDLLTFVNLTSGTIQGIEAEGHYQIDQHWSFEFGAHLMEGDNDQGESLSDIPSNRFFLGGKWRQGAWFGQLRWEERAEKDDPGSGEKPIPSASLLSAALEYEVKEGLWLSVNGRNLLDTSYFNSPDRKVPYSPGRSLGITLRWRPL
ncbi:MAG: TonB-dependent receptor [Nitrospirae bacterium]|nr:TonB-dependent receptor [Nitrospirota bacterium]